MLWCREVFAAPVNAELIQISGAAETSRSKVSKYLHRRYSKEGLEMDMYMKISQCYES